MKDLLQLESVLLTAREEVEAGRHSPPSWHYCTSHRLNRNNVCGMSEVGSGATSHHLPVTP
eukprot:scaffold2858_cov245-Ochromonas_danica.AAC.22